MSSENPEASLPGDLLPDPRPDPRSARDRILAVAGPLFYREGYRGVGVDRVIAEAGVAKATFYRHFPAKDDLIIACIDRAEVLIQTGEPETWGATPLSDHAMAMIRVARQPFCMGCAFQGSAAEYGAMSHPVHAAARAVKARVLADLVARARAQGLADPEAAGRRVFLFLEGVWSAVRMFGPEAPLADVEADLRRLIG